MNWSMSDITEIAKRGNDDPDAVQVVFDDDVKRSSIVPDIGIEPKEHDEQVWFFEWIDMQSLTYPELLCCFAVPNGGYRPNKTGADLKAEGVRSGVPDIFLSVARNGYHGLCIEMKRRKSGSLEPNQKVWIERLKEQGYRVEMCRGCDAAIKIVKEYLGIAED